jgi:DNA replication ATP-dependent helicase Dna2
MPDSSALSFGGHCGDFDPVYKSPNGRCSPPWPGLLVRAQAGFFQCPEFMSQREIIDALEEELRVCSKPLKFTVSEVKPAGPSLFKIFINSANSAHGLDESLEGAGAGWPGPPPGTADVLSVSAEHDQINIRYLSGPPPRKGGQIVLHPPRYLEALRDIWKSPLFADASLGWLETVTALNYSPLPDVRSVPGFPQLRDRQRQAFGLLDREFGFLWGPPGTGKTYTVGAILAAYLRQRPQARILILSTTNWAVDIALLAVDRSLEELERTDPAAHQLRQRCKRIGTHFIAGNYKGREHLLPVVDSALVRRIAELETQMPDRSNAAAYAIWKDKISALRAQIPKPIDQAQVAAMTTTGAAFSYRALQARKPFDLILFDESSQVSLPHALVLAPLGRRVVFAGDHKQLAPIVRSAHPEAKKWLGVSMFKYMNPENRCFLNEQSRMAEEICDIVSDVFYDGELIVAEKCATDVEWRAERRSQFVPGIGTNRVHLENCPAEGDFKQTKYGSGTRYKSAEYIGQVVPSLTGQVGEENVLVLTPYRAQRGLIKTFLRNAGQTKVPVSTVHRAQGSEYHTVIFDPVIATGERLLGHPAEGPRLINVALSRAKARLVVILSDGDYANEYLRRIAHVISGEG